MFPIKNNWSKNEKHFPEKIFTETKFPKKTFIQKNSLRKNFPLPLSLEKKKFAGKKVSPKIYF